MWKRFISSGWCIAVAAIIGMALSLPSLTSGLIADDFFHWEVLTGRFNNDHPGALLGLFSFADGNPERAHEFMAKGIYPWWTADTVRLSFWRPLAELTHWIDYRLWPDSPMLMHAQNIVWYGALIVVLGIWLRAIDNNKTRAGLATLIYAISAMHGTAVGWIANRNALIAVFFSVLCLIGFHHACQNRHSRRRRYVLYGISLAAFSLSLLAGESAIAVTPFLFAYALLLDTRENFLSRMIALIPYAGVVLVWKYLYSHFGYGSYGSGTYIDPATDIVKFLPVAAMRIPVLLLAQLFGVPSLLFNFMATPAAQIAYTSIAIVALILFFLAIRAMNLHRDKYAQFFGLAMLFASIPICATAPDDRLLTFVGIGGAGLLATWLCAVAERFKELRGKGGIALKVFAGYLILLHLIVMPALFPSNVRAMARTMTPYIEYPAISLPEDKLTARTRVMFINPPLPSCVSYLPFVRDYHGLKKLRSAMAMAPGSRDMFMTAVDDRTVRITVPQGFIAPLDNFFRDPNLRFKPGDSVDLDGVEVTVVKVTRDGQPESAQFQFADALQSSNVQFYLWDRGRYRAFQLPSIGKRMAIRAFDFKNPQRETVVE